MALIIAVDPSGNHNSEKEGMGITGLAVYDRGKITLHEIKAEDYATAVSYWDAVVQFIRKAEYLVVEGYKLYNHAGMSAQTQSNSTLMTSQLIGAMKLEAHRYGIPITIQYAADVKTRWSDKVLQAKGILEPGNKFDGKQTNNHKRDALRHLTHYRKYVLKGRV